MKLPVCTQDKIGWQLTTIRCILYETYENMVTEQPWNLVGAQNRKCILNLLEIWRSFDRMLFQPSLVQFAVFHYRYGSLPRQKIR